MRSAVHIGNLFCGQFCVGLCDLDGSLVHYVILCGCFTRERRVFCLSQVGLAHDSSTRPVGQDGVVVVDLFQTFEKKPRICWEVSLRELRCGRRGSSSSADRICCA